METAITSSRTAIVEAGQVANTYAAAGAFADYMSRKATRTLRAQHDDLATFGHYLCEATAGAECPTADQLQTDPAAWHGVTWGLVAGFLQWMLGAGYAVTSANRKLCTVKVYAKLAAQAGILDRAESAMIRTVSGHSSTEGKRVDEKRTAAGRATRTGHKKAQHVTISREQAQALKTQPGTPQGRRDALIMCLLLDHGLRVGELAGLTDQAIQPGGLLVFYRPKVDKTQTHRLTADSLRAVTAYFLADAPKGGLLLRPSSKSGELLTGAGMSERAITERVRVLGAAVGLAGLSAHDCRHYWATRAATAGTDAFALRDAGGWSSLAMPSRYVEAATVANERVIL
jgi:integrase